MSTNGSEAFIPVYLPQYPISSASLGFQSKMHKAFSSESVQILQNAPGWENKHNTHGYIHTSMLLPQNTKYNQGTQLQTLKHYGKKNNSI